VRHAIGIALTLAAAGCGRLTGPNTLSDATSPAEVVLGVGHAVRVDGNLLVRFLGVPADSRCPARVLCVWVGDAAVALTISAGTGPSQPDTLHTALDPKTLERGGYTVTLLEVTPYPELGGAIPANAYQVRLRVDSGGPVPVLSPRRRGG
jgi:hypothetical protein